jgi:phospholipase/carboxylesterase
LALGLLAAQPPAALVALSTYLPVADRLAADAPPGRSLPPVFMAHGSYDPVVPYGAGEVAADRLRALGFDVDWRSYPIGHEACLEELADLTAWLSRRFADG